MASSISVAVRVRPPTEKERSQLQTAASTSTAVFGDGCLSSTPTSSAVLASHRTSHSLRPIIKVLDQRVLIFDPPESNPVHQAQKQILARMGGGKKVKDMRFCFDRVFDEEASQEDVYEGAARDLVGGVLDGYNATVFAYGATGCGKTHTITGTPEAPGIVYLLMRDLFGRMEAKKDEMTVEVSISYLEIYNETIRDLLSPSSPPLNLREANASVSVPGLSTEAPTCASDVVRLISAGNAYRTVHGTEANAVSSRSHAVLSVNIRQKPRTDGLSENWTVATLSVIDLAGSERASVTRNKGERLLEGANINRSLLALGNCINALCDPRKRNHVPYRDSKLTRLLKHSLGGNCRTLMIVCVAPTSAHYDETHNTLQYANRAKEIKTKATRNVISVDRHVSQYVQVIFQLREELEQRKREDEERLDKAKKEWQRGHGELQGALAKAKAHWSEATAKAVPAAKARGELRALARLDEALQRWRATVDVGVDIAWATAPLDSLATEVGGRAASLQTVARSAEAATSMYEALVASLGRSVEAKCGTGERMVFEKEVNGGKGEWGLEGLGARAVAAAEREGEAEAVAGFIARVAEKVQDVSGGFVRTLLGELDTDARNNLLQLGERLDRANREIFSALGSRHDAATASSSSTSAAPPLAFPSNFFSVAGTKRDSGTRSPIEVGEAFRPGKASRHGSSTAPLTSMSSPVRPTTYFAKRASPRKQVVFPNRAHGGILKARNNHSPGKVRANKGGVGFAGTSGEKGKAGVRWKDEAGEGWELESFDETKEAESSAEASVEASSLEGSALLPRALADPFASTSTIGRSSVPDAPSADDSILGPPFAKAPPRPGRASLGGRMKQGFLSRNRAIASRATSLQSLGEEGEEETSLVGPGDTAAAPTGVSFLATDPYPRQPLGDVGNSSVASSASSSSQKEIPASNRRTSAAVGGRTARRTSSIGPMRTAKSNRRLSLTKLPPASANNSSGSIASHGGKTGPPSVSDSSLPAASPRKSPRKATSLRRTSLAPGGSLAGAKARRVSALSAGHHAAVSAAASSQIFGNSLRSDSAGSSSRGPVWR